MAPGSIPEPLWNGCDMSELIDMESSLCRFHGLPYPRGGCPGARNSARAAHPKPNPPSPDTTVLPALAQPQPNAKLRLPKPIASKEQSISAAEQNWPVFCTKGVSVRPTPQPAGALIKVRTGPADSA
jgi:hypothetical protein